jgi:uncharacterized FlgJ-related protein
MNKRKINIVMGLLLSISVLIIGIFIGLSVDKPVKKEIKIKVVKDTEIRDSFNTYRLRSYINDLNIRFPYIVYAQARLETGNFRSGLFKQNHNLFGMMRATTRPSTNIGERHGYAVYDNWKTSVVDMAFYQAAYLNRVKTEEQYLAYLKANYGEASDYMKILKQIIAEEKRYLVMNK